jgi:hypothetical protein
MCKAVEIGRKGDALRCHPGIKNLILSINFHQNCDSKEYIYRHHCTKFYKLLMNTTGAHNLKEFNNTGGWLSGFIEIN